MYAYLTLLALFLFAYCLAAGRLQRTPVSGPILYVLFGVGLSLPFFGLPSQDIPAETLRALAELTLALVLFTDAANADLALLRHSSRLPQRLLLVGLPLTIVLGFFGALAIFPGLGLFEAAILATMLAPTDAALGQAVVTNPAVPPVIRDGLNVESGLNDGICVPILFVFLTLAADAANAHRPLGLALHLVLEEIGLGALAGLGIALAGVLLLRFCARLGWVVEEWRRLAGMALALACFAAAQWAGGSGFIASFTGGLLFGGLTKRHKEGELLAAEAVGDILGLLTWVAFGYAVVGSSLLHFDWKSLLYAALSLTLFRMLPVWLCLGGMRLDAASKLFMGWFGPRGLASIVFAIIVMGDKLPGKECVLLTVVCTILLSVFAHGVTAEPLAAAFGSKENPPDASGT